MSTELPHFSFEGRSLRLGLATPVLIMVPGLHASWELDAGIAEVAKIAKAADRLGYNHMSCSEHVAIPTDVGVARGSRYWDPLSTFGYLAAVTTKIRLATNVLVLGYNHPLAISKRYGTLDQITGGRLILGLGVGSLREEFELLEAPLDDRGARADDAIRALRASLSSPRPEYHGPFYSFSDVVLDPCARQERVPLWIGGRTARSLRRAVELGDGWVPFGVEPGDLSIMIEKARQTPAWSARTRPFELVLQNNLPADPMGDAEGTRRALRGLTEAGATGIQLRIHHRSVAHYIEQLGAMIDVLD